MPAPIVLTVVLCGFGLVVVTVVALNDGAPMDFGGLFPAHGRSDWPQGVQEGDAPRFALDRLDRSRTPGATTRAIQDITAAEPATPPTERLDPRIRRLAL